MARVQVTAAELKRGDYLPGSRQVVAIAPDADWDNAGRVRLTVITNRDTVRRVSWNRRTTMMVDRPDSSRCYADVDCRIYRVLRTAESYTEAAEVDLSPAAVRRRLIAGNY